MTEELRAYEKEQQVRTHALLLLADIVNGDFSKLIHSSLPSLCIEAICQRVEWLSKEIRKENMGNSNTEFNERMAKVDGKTFDAYGFRFKRFTPSAKYEYVGNTGKKIKSLEIQIKKLKLEIARLEKGAKASIPTGKLKGTGVVKVIPEIREGVRQFSMSLIAPKERPDTTYPENPHEE